MSFPNSFEGLVCATGRFHDRGTWMASYADVENSRRTVIMPSMFPPDETGEKTEIREVEQNGSVSDLHLHSSQLDCSNNVKDKSEGVSFIPLERCMRIMPHDQNGGAFFIAVLHKVADLPVITQKNLGKEENSLSDSTLPKEAEAIEDSKNLPDISTDGMDKLEPIPEVCPDSEEYLLKQESSATVGEDVSKDAEEPAAEMENDAAKVGSKRKLQMQGKWRGVDPVVVFKDEAVIDSIKTFYGITDSFQFTGHLVTRNKETSRVKRIYYISKSVRDLLELNFKVGEQLKITSIGLKMFERQTSREGTTAPCTFRISSEGLPLILPYITKQILHASVVDFKHLLQYKSVKFGDLVDSELGEKASQLLPGCCVIVLKDDSSLDAEADASSIAIGCWRGRASLSVMVTAIDCQELLVRLLARTESKTELGADGKQPLNGIDHGSYDENSEEHVVDDTSIAAEG
ncbi:hypothetical protein MLD38_031328 [Melastoma candidum]|uniref:Uncharacterized protein n=1 Tax=Melastoma candidum TaxID=119954 RepID=A0ACB9MU74_9MYRT|nr:hypothetical protein MLD38_031328 [Melastoma candidum]